MTELVDELLWLLSEARKRKQEARNAKQTLLDNLMNSPDFQIAKAALEQAENDVGCYEAEIKRISKDAFAQDGNKHPHPKIEIKNFKVFKIIDDLKVLSWVKTNLADALIYDTAKVKNYALKIGAVDGAEVSEEISVQIASQLS